MATFMSGSDPAYTSLDEISWSIIVGSVIGGVLYFAFVDQHWTMFNKSTKRVAEGTDGTYSYESVNNEDGYESLIARAKTQESHTTMAGLSRVFPFVVQLGMIVVFWILFIVTMNDEALLTWPMTTLRVIGAIFSVKLFVAWCFRAYAIKLANDGKNVSKKSTQWVGVIDASFLGMYVLFLGSWVWMQYPSPDDPNVAWGMRAAFADTDSLTPTFILLGSILCVLHIIFWDMRYVWAGDAYISTRFFGFMKAMIDKRAGDGGQKQDSGVGAFVKKHNLPNGAAGIASTSTSDGALENSLVNPDGDEPRVVYKSYTKGSGGKEDLHPGVGVAGGIGSLGKGTGVISCTTNVAHAAASYAIGADVGDIGATTKLSEKTSPVYLGTDEIIVANFRGYIMGTMVSSPVIFWTLALTVVFFFVLWRDTQLGAQGAFACITPIVVAAFSTGHIEYFSEVLSVGMLAFVTVLMGDHYIFANESRHLSSDLFLATPGNVLTDNMSYNSTHQQTTTQVSSTMAAFIPVLLMLPAAWTRNGVVRFNLGSLVSFRMSKRAVTPEP